MASLKLDCCATFQKFLIFAINILLFIFGVIQIGIASYFLSAGTKDLGFISDVLEGNDTAVNAMLAFGVVFVFISFFACLGAVKNSTCMLWIYAVIFFFMIMGQAMTLAVVTVSVQYGDSIFGSMWRDLDADTINDIENTYECCSFNGDNDSWLEDEDNYAACSDTKNFHESCWQKFEDKVDTNYNMIKVAVAVFLGFQILIYFSTHYVIQSIAEAEGIEDERNIQMGNQPRV